MSKKRRKRRDAQHDSVEGTSTMWRLPSCELRCILCIVMLAGGIRCALPSSIAIEHFDAGVYASNVFIPAEAGGAYPARHLYAPPLLSWIIEATILSEVVATGEPGASQITPILPNLIAGCVTVLLTYFAGRVWFGSGIAITAALLATFSDLHVLLSRTGLTDVVLLMACVLAVLLTSQAARNLDYRFAVGAGLATAMGWWTKYNGWLPLAIGLSGSLGMLIFVPSTRKHAWGLLGMWGITAAVSIVLWIPCLISLQDVGGYAAVSENHAKYMHSLSGWWPAVVSQIGNLWLLDSPLGIIGFAAAGWCASPRAPRSAKAASSILCGSLTAVFGSVITICLFSIVAVVRIWRRALSGIDDSETIPSWLLMAWLVGLTVATPIYHPYPRLTMTLIGCGWFIAALGCRSVTDQMAVTLQRESFRWQRQSTIGLIVGLLIMGILVTATRGVSWHALDARNGLMNIAQEMAANCSQVSAGQSPIIFVYGEPALFYHLSATGDVVAVPTAGTNCLNAQRPVYLAGGPHANRSSSYREMLATHRSRIRPVRQYPYRASTQVMLNQLSASELSADPSVRNQMIELYRVSPAQGE